MEKYYKFGSDVGNKKTPYAPTIVNHKKLFKDCSKCGSSDLSEDIKEINLLIEGKGKLPDTILCGHYPLLIVSERVLNAWKENSITGYINYHVKLLNSEGKEISQESKYYNIEITGRAELDLNKMGVKIINECTECGKVTYNKDNWDFGKAIMKDNTYDNSDLFVVKHFERAPLCNKKILEIIYTNKFTNFRFKKFEDLFDYLSPDIDIKSLFK